MKIEDYFSPDTIARADTAEKEFRQAAELVLKEKSPEWLRHKFINQSIEYSVAYCMLKRLTARVHEVAPGQGVPGLIGDIQVNLNDLLVVMRLLDNLKEPVIPTREIFAPPGMIAEGWMRKP